MQNTAPALALLVTLWLSVAAAAPSKEVQKVKRQLWNTAWDIDYIKRSHEGDFINEDGEGENYSIIVSSFFFFHWSSQNIGWKSKCHWLIVFSEIIIPLLEIIYLVGWWLTGTYNCITYD